MVALTYDVRTVRIPVPRIVLRRARAERRPARPRTLEPWQRAERVASRAAPRRPSRRGARGPPLTAPRHAEQSARPSATNSG